MKGRHFLVWAWRRIPWLAGAVLVVLGIAVVAAFIERARLTGNLFLGRPRGSGNFLVIAYIKMREIEFEIMRRLGETRGTQIKLENFYGVEIRSFPVEIARLSLGSIRQRKPAAGLSGNSIRSESPTATAVGRRFPSAPTTISAIGRKVIRVGHIGAGPLRNNI
jgi:restriction-modification enzyme MmeI-like protein